MSDLDLLVPPDQAAIDRGVALFAAAARRRYGDALRGLFLFGSRARGDASPYSDVDLAIVVEDAVDVRRDTGALSALTYDVLVESGAEVQPWVFRESEWRDPACSSSPRLLRSASRDAKPVGVG